MIEVTVPFDTSNMIHLLVIDRDPTALAGLEALLSSNPDIVVKASAGTIARALEVLVTPIALDIAVVDEKLPDGNGAEFCSRAVELRPTVGCILHTIGVSSRLAASDIGVSAVVDKHLDQSMLLSHIRRIATPDRHDEPTRQLPSLSPPYSPGLHAPRKK